MAIVRVSQKGYILIPKNLRKKYKVDPGGKVQLIENEGKLFIQPAPEDPVEAACGFLKGEGYSLTEDLLNERKKEMDGEKSSYPG